MIIFFLSTFCFQFSSSAKVSGKVLKDFNANGAYLVSSGTFFYMKLEFAMSGNYTFASSGNAG